MANLTHIVHTSPYAAISPSLPSLSQSGKTVFITGGSAGIGYAIARAFMQANASTIVICGRRSEIVSSAVSKLAAEEGRHQIKVIGRTCDVADPARVTELWAGLKDEGIVIDILVLNAASMQTTGPLLGAELDAVWAEFNTNVRAILNFSQIFYSQRDGISGNERKKVCTFQTQD